MCGAVVPSGGSPGVYFRGRRIDFCTHACVVAFKREPERFAPAPPPPTGPSATTRRSPFAVRLAPAADDDA